ncbi:MAG TPA: DUF3641 domain-containing protein [Casimicrobiaceae bacterium]|nr:DUF3641 domain-containing protein [Casimicrobiaceae bacterium]
MLRLPLAQRGKRQMHLSELDVNALVGNAVSVADHCYGCTAGQGSSCGGATTT